MTQSTNNLATALLLETPHTLALLMTSAAIFIGEIDPHIRKQLENKKMQLKHWNKLYHLSRSIHPYVIVTSALTAIASYHLTKEVTWLYGAATIATTIPLTLIVIKPICK
jgi:K+-sensing histidine kinase KdpD